MLCGGGGAYAFILIILCLVVNCTDTKLSMGAGIISYRGGWVTDVLQIPGYK